MNLNWFWQRKQDRKKDEYKAPWPFYKKALRKELRKRLIVPIGGKKKTHDMDDDMFESLLKMLASEDDADVEIAREIIFNTNMTNRHVDELVHKHGYVLLYGPEHRELDEQGELLKIKA